VDKWLGDGVMLVGVDVEPIVAAVVAICNQMSEVGELPMRAGVATGPVIILEGDDYVGKAVNTAARLCDRAEAGMILAATDALVLPDWVEAEDCPPLHVRGLADPVQVVSLSAAAGAGPHTTSLAPATAIMSVVDGLVRRGAQARLIRGGTAIYDGKIGTLRRMKDDAREVTVGLECGIVLDNQNDVLVGDIIECYVIQPKPR